MLCIYMYGCMVITLYIASAAGNGLTNITENHTFVPRDVISDCFDAEGGSNRCITLCCVCAPRFVNQEKYPRQKSMNQTNAARSGRDPIASCIYVNIPTSATQILCVRPSFDATKV